MGKHCFAPNRLEFLDAERTKDGLTFKPEPILRCGGTERESQHIDSGDVDFTIEDFDIVIDVKGVSKRFDELLVAKKLRFFMFRGDCYEVDRTVRNGHLSTTIYGKAQ